MTEAISKHSNIPGVVTTPKKAVSVEELRAKIEEEFVVRMAIAKPILENNLYKFNRSVIEVEKGKGMLPLAPVHKELCEFIDQNKHKKKLVLIPRGHLKALKTSGTEVITPTGKKKYSELVVGDIITGGSGSPVKVREIHPKSQMELYRVTTNDGRELICNKEHLFRVRICQNSKRWKIRSLEWIAKRYSVERLDKRDGIVRHEHPVQLKPIPVFFNEKQLLVDPYTLGMWLGDGHSAGGRMTTADPEIFGYSSFSWEKQSGKYSYGTKGLQTILKKIDVFKNKHIPDEYSYSSYDQRLLLLRGLMDTDGTCHKQGGIAYFSNTNYRLIKNFISLVRGLGGVAMCCKVNMLVHDEPYDTWTVSVKLPNGLNPFLLKRKADKFTGLKRELTINIVDIEMVDDDVANCITLDSDDGMFLVNDYFPTHNSTTVTVARTLQAICKDQTTRVLIANATYGLACSFLTEIKRHLKFNDKIKMVWGDLAQNVEKWSENQITLSKAKQQGGKKEPTVTAMGVESNLTSQHYDLIIADDLINKDYINTPEQIQKTIDFYKECLNLLEPDGEMIILGTRWHDQDLYGWILDPENKILNDFEVFHREAYEGDLETDEGFKALYPQKFTRKHLLKLREQQGPYFFSSQYMNNPIPMDDADFRQDWFKQYDPTDLKGRPLNKFTAIDPAISLERSADFTAMVTVGVDEFGFIYVLDVERVKVPPNELIELIFQKNRIYRPLAIGIEDVAFQKTLQYTLSEEMQKRQEYLPIRPIRPNNRTKDQRIRGLQPLYANGRILHCSAVKNTNNLEDELLRFPRAKHDDVIDSLAYLLDFMFPAKRKKHSSENSRKHKYLYR